VDEILLRFEYAKKKSLDINKTVGKIMSFLLISFLAPLVGMVMRARRAVSCIGIFFAAKWLLGIAPITFGLPTTCGTAYWSLWLGGNDNFKKKFMKFYLSVVLPLVCMLLFVLHPVGQRAFVYSFYWLIPIAAYGIQMFKGRSVLLISLSSSFIMHAVGSVMWLYFVPSVPEKWIALLPVVAVERLMITAAGIVVFAFLKPLFYTERNKKIIPSIFVRTNP